jgi:hypothetical protein
MPARKMPDPDHFVRPDEPIQLELQERMPIHEFARQISTVNRSKVYLHTLVDPEADEMLWDLEERFAVHDVRPSLELQIKTNRDGQILEFIPWSLSESGDIQLPPTWIFFLFAMINAKFTTR